MLKREDKDRRGMVIGMDCSDLLIQMLDEDGSFANFCDEKEKENLDILKELEKCNVPEDLLERVRAAENLATETVLALTDELRHANVKYVVMPERVYRLMINLMTVRERLMLKERLLEVRNQR